MRHGYLLCLLRISTADTLALLEGSSFGFPISARQSLTQSHVAPFDFDAFSSLRACLVGFFDGEAFNGFFSHVTLPI
jgi:hypothetical protein